MGKTKHEKKFDRNVVISAPILDPEVIKKIHSPPKDQKRDIRHGGFKALLSDFNSQDSTDELTPITENHLPSYIGISCAVSGYSNYSSYGRKLLDEPITRTEPKTHKLATTGSKLAPERSQTNSPLAVKNEQFNIHHVTIDKSTISSADEERKELTEKLTASAVERRLSPSPLPPTNEDRHHGAYVGARYFPMPEPSKLVNKHIPLLGIDDDVDPDEIVVDDIRKVEQKIASLYGENFVEDWKEAMSHKSKKELHDERLAERAAPTNLKEIVNLKPTPPKAPQPDEPIEVDIPTPNVKVLANVEKQFLNKLLTDENPPMPKSPSPQPTPPQLVSPVRNVCDNFQKPVSPVLQKDESPVASPADPCPRSPDPVSTHAYEPEQDAPNGVESAPERESLLDLHDDVANGQDVASIEAEPLMAPDSDPASPEHAQHTQSAHLILDAEDKLLVELDEEPHGDSLDGAEISNKPEEISTTENEANEALFLSVDETQAMIASEEPHRSRSSSGSSRDYAKSPESQMSSSTVERAPSKPQPGDLEQSEDHIEYEIRSQSPPMNNESSPVKLPEKSDDDSTLVSAAEVITHDGDNKLVSFSPEPESLPVPETNNNLEDLKQTVDLIKMLETEEPVHEQPSQAEGADVAGPEPDSQEGGAEAEKQKLAAEKTGESNDGHYFLALLAKEESFIMEKVRLAEQLLGEHEHEMDEERVGRIHSAIGKANLLINKKCNQFRGLCEKSITGDANDQYAVLSDDLAGFWDMIQIQIVDVRRSLENP